MRRIGTLSDLAKARRFRNYLLTRDVDSVIETGSCDATWEVWVRNEDDVETSMGEFASFQAAPEDPRFAVDDEANHIREEKIAQRWGPRGPTIASEVASDIATGATTERTDRIQSLAQEPREPSGDVNPLLDSESKQTGFPVTIVIIALSVIASFSTNFGEPRGSRIPGKVTLEQQIFHGLTFVDRRDYEPDQDPFAELRKGEVWRIFTPMFLHGSMFHLFFNLFFIYLLGSMIERIHGSFFFLFLVLFAQASGMMVQVLLPDAAFMPESLRGSPFAIGASGVAYGFFGFMWIRPWLDHDYPIELDPTQFMMILGGLIICMTPIVPNVANGAHLGGLAAGMIVAAIGIAFKR